MSLLCLPDGPLKLVMQYVPRCDRLTSCCLVSKRLHAAAVAATDTVVLCRQLQDPMSGLQWLSQYGENVTHLEIYQLTQPLRQLPCPDLQELKLGGAISVQLGPAAGGEPGVLQGCTHLTRLEVYCKIVDCPVMDGVSSLSRLVHLQHLDFLPRRSGMRLLEGSAQTAQALPSAVLPCLKHLTELYVSHMSFENLMQLGELTRLQCLALKADVPVDPHNIPGLVLPASLTKLEVWSSVETGLLCLAPKGLQQLMLECDVQGPAEGPGSLLSCMGRLQHLTSLELRLYHDIPEARLSWPPVGPAYSALTASSKLAALDMHDVLLPAGAWPFIFPSSHTLPHLTSLLVTFDSVEWGEPPPACAWGPADLSSLISCCPNLCMFGGDICWENGGVCMQHGLHVSALHKLTALTSVHLRFGPGDAAAFQESLKGLAAIPQLRALMFTLDTADLSTGWLLPLTGLTDLTRLHCNLHQDSDMEPLSYIQEGAAPDVWLQLLERCAADKPGCQPAALRSLAQQLAEQRALLALQQQQLSDQQDDASQQRTAGEHQQQQLAVMQTQQSAQQYVVGEQGVRIEGLEVQLQQLQEQLERLLQRQP